MWIASWVGKARFYDRSETLLFIEKAANDASFIDGTKIKPDGKPPKSDAFQLGGFHT